MLWIVDTHRDDGKGFVVHADERLSGSIELEVAIVLDEQVRLFQNSDLLNRV